LQWWSRRRRRDIAHELAEWSHFANQCVYGRYHHPPIEEEGREREIERERERGRERERKSICGQESLRVASFVGVFV